MSRADVDAFLAECDDVIEEWEGSDDSATWAADGSHEHDTDGHYYGNSRGYGGIWVELRRAMERYLDEEALCRALSPVVDWTASAPRWVTSTPREQPVIDDAYIARVFDVPEALLQRGTGYSHLSWRAPDPISDETRALFDRAFDPVDSARLWRESRP